MQYRNQLAIFASVMSHQPKTVGVGMGIWQANVTSQKEIGGCGH